MAEIGREMFDRDEVRIRDEKKGVIRRSQMIFSMIKRRKDSLSLSLVDVTHIHALAIFQNRPRYAEGR